MSGPAAPGPGWLPLHVAPACTSWDTLAARASTCFACPDLVASRTRVVAGDAVPGSPLLLVGEAPGAEEDRLGHPFVGRSGRLLDEVLAECGVRRQLVAVSNVVKCRPALNRAPTRRETNTCRPWLDRQIDLLDPRVVVAMGSTAVAWAFGAGSRIRALRPVIHEVAGRHWMATYHPSAALRFGPNGEPARALRADLAQACRLAGLAG